MSANEWEETGNDSGGFAALRKAHKAQGKEMAELKAQLAELTKASRTAGVNEALASRGLDPRVAKFYPKDRATTDESVDEWVEENRDLFGGRLITDDSSQVNKSSLTDAEIRGYQAMQDMAAYDRAAQQDLETQMNRIEFDRNNPEAASKALMDLLRNYQTPTG